MRGRGEGGDNVLQEEFYFTRFAWNIFYSCWLKSSLLLFLPTQFLPREYRYSQFLRLDLVFLRHVCWFRQKLITKTRLYICSSLSLYDLTNTINWLCNWSSILPHQNHHLICFRFHQQHIPTALKGFPCVSMNAGNRMSLWHKWRLSSDERVPALSTGSHKNSFLQ